MGESARAAEELFGAPLQNDVLDALTRYEQARGRGREGRVPGRNNREEGVVTGRNEHVKENEEEEEEEEDFEDVDWEEIRRLEEQHRMSVAASVGSHAAVSLFDEDEATKSASAAQVVALFSPRGALPFNSPSAKQLQSQLERSLGDASVPSQVAASTTTARGKRRSPDTGRAAVRQHERQKLPRTLLLDEDEDDEEEQRAEKDADKVDLAAAAAADDAMEQDDDPDDAPELPGPACFPLSSQMSLGDADLTCLEQPQFGLDDFDREVERLQRHAQCGAEDGQRLERLALEASSQLKPYQKVGVAHILLNKRTLLYDEMGLGKTVQAIFGTMLQAFARSSWPVLCVLPAALRMTWLVEFERWVPCLGIDDICVVKSTRSPIPASCRVVICSYGMLHHNHAELAQRNFQFLVADEVHRTRTPDSKKALSLVSLARSIPNVVLITGTPMLIRPFELFSQLNVVLHPKDKETLLPLWGGGAVAGGRRLSASQSARSSSLCAFLTKPLEHFDAICASFALCRAPSVFENARRLARASAEQAEFKAIWDSIDELGRYHIAQPLHLAADEIKAMVSLSIGGATAGAAEAKTKLENELRRTDQGCPRDWAARPTLEVLYCKMGSLLKLWNLLRSFGSGDGFISAILHIWEAHRFGMRYCDGKRDTRRFAGRRRWQYPGGTTNNLRALKRVLHKYVVRRRKADVLQDLPTKRRSIVRLAVRGNTGSNPPGESFDASGTEEGTAQRGAATDLGELSLFSNERPENVSWELHKIGVGKALLVADYLVELLNNLDVSERVIVFGRHLKLLHGIQSILQQKRGGDPEKPCYKLYSSHVLCGEVPHAERDRVVNLFQHDELDGPRVLVLSMDAMGQGWTLTRSSIVIMAELHFSPQVLLQAEDRAHRIGQKDSVSVQYLVVPNSIEAEIWPMLSARLGRMEAALRFEDDSPATATAPAACAPDRNRHFRVDLNATQGRAVLDISAEAGNTVQDQQDAAQIAGGTLVSQLSTQPGTTARERLDPDKLRFRVSSTGRVHLFEERGEPPGVVALGENLGVPDFRLVAQEWVARDGSGVPRDLLMRLPACLRRPGGRAFLLTQAFIEDWLSQSAMARNTLMGLRKPVCAPLSAALGNVEPRAEDIATFQRACSPAFQLHRSAINSVGQNNYVVGIVRFRSQHVFSSALVNEYRCVQQAFDRETREPLCLFCGSLYSAAHKLPLEAASALGEEMFVVQVDQGIKALFCGGHAPCYASWHLRCYQGSARVQLSEVEQGVCRMCKVDTRAMFYRARSHPPGSQARKNELFCTSCEPLGLCPHKVSSSITADGWSRLHWSSLQRDILAEKHCAKLLGGTSLSEGQFWDADHIVAVALGGGASSLGNFQTLCKPCHLAKTSEDRKQIASLKQQQARHTRAMNQQTRDKIAADRSLVCVRCGFQCDSVNAKLAHALICPAQ
ncbi:SWI/SNF-related matrix-associated actin-dependent regulator of chromatin subfamily A-like protein 1 homolog [Durusdinium trenchii]|uniref:SWI/SNF-related matrix-associated actin-dependent regulator of chromatin subfamily A-like protein 1 homolog n=1 Tax=Durusdinium trenchii TaxID=1381693 RepID=A0ABP0HKJ2_9DINO